MSLTALSQLLAFGNGLVELFKQLHTGITPGAADAVRLTAKFIFQLGQERHFLQPSTQQNGLQIPLSPGSQGLNRTQFLQADGEELAVSVVVQWIQLPHINLTGLPA